MFVLQNVFICCSTHRRYSSSG